MKIVPFIHFFKNYPSFKALILSNNSQAFFVSKDHKIHWDFFKNFFKISLTEMTAIDFPERIHRFFLVYLFLNYTTTSRFYLFHNIIDQTSTLSHHFSSGSWLEREIFDNYGIFFSHHKDLRRLLSDYGFSFFPLRKDFPLQGYHEVFFSLENKRISFSSVEFQQAFRLTSKKNPFL